MICHFHFPNSFGTEVVLCSVIFLPQPGLVYTVTLAGQICLYQITQMNLLHLLVTQCDSCCSPSSSSLGFDTLWICEITHIVIEEVHLGCCNEFMLSVHYLHCTVIWVQHKINSYGSAMHDNLMSLLMPQHRLISLSCSPYISLLLMSCCFLFSSFPSIFFTVLHPINPTESNKESTSKISPWASCHV